MNAKKLLSIVTVAVSTAALQIPSTAAEAQCPSRARRAEAQWPPAPEGDAFDVVHFGEAHWNEGQGPKTMPVLVQDVVAYGPEFVLFSSDIADTGTRDRLTCFRAIMEPLGAAGIPWFNSPGNHDRVQLAGPGGVLNGAIAEWRDVFADMPAPWGDAAAPDRRFLLPDGEPSDGKGASTHYYFDYAPDRKRAMVRVIVLDNSMHSLTTADTDQYPEVGPGAKDPGQLAFLQRVAARAQEKGLMTWVVMHQPTRDPREVTNAHPSSYNHTMGKGASPDNALFDAIAGATGVDAVFLGHIQGNALYRVEDVEYYIDGGGGGSPYAMNSVGTDTGYFYGFRIMRSAPTSKGWTVRTYFVPLVDTLKVEAPRRVVVGDEVRFAATAVQPFDPDLPPRAGILPNAPIELELRPPTGDPSVPELAYAWESLNPGVLRPIHGDRDGDDPAMDPKTMTSTGRFEAVRPGVARVRILVGTRSKVVRVEVTR